MLKIRLQRVGKRNHAEFRVVVCEHTTGPKSGKHREVIGAYNPHTDTVALREERARYWLSVGAQPSDTVYNLLVGAGVIEGKKKNVLPRKTPVRTDGGEDAGGDSDQHEADALAETKEEEKEEDAAPSTEECAKEKAAA